MVGGFLSESQALKLDARDFLGDGLITFSLSGHVLVADPDYSRPADPGAPGPRDL